MVLTLLSICLAARSNAVMDIITHHYSSSIFSTLNRDLYWDPAKSWKNKYINRDFKKGRVKIKILGKEFNKHPAFTDGWHKHKSLMIVYICLIPLLFTIDSKLSTEINPIILGAVYFLITGLTWNKVFMYYYKEKFKI